MRRTVLLSLMGLLPALGLAALPLAAQATPVTYTVGSGGLDGAFICLSTAINCTSSNDLFIYDPPSPPPNAFDAATGTITLDDMLGTVTIALSVSSGTFVDSAGAVGGVDEVEFTNLGYAATITGATFTIDSQGTLITWSPQNVVTVSGDYEQLLGGSNVAGPTAFSKSGVRMPAGQCRLRLDGILVCGFVVGPGPNATGFQLSIGGANRKIVHTLNVEAVPEPSLIGLLGVGLIGLALVARRRI